MNKTSLNNLSKGSSKMTLIFSVGALIVIGVIGYYIMRSNNTTLETEIVNPSSEPIETENGLAFPLGTGKYSLSGPMQGGVYFCQSIKDVFTNPIGAHAAGPWIDEKDGIWYPSLRIPVQGENTWPEAYAHFTKQENIREIKVNALPTKGYTGNFPVAKTDPDYQYDRNPNAAEETPIVWQVPFHPELAAKPTCVPLQSVGVSLNGISLYAAADGHKRDPAYEVSDGCMGHPGPNGEYHYHIVAGNSCIGLVDDQNPVKESELIGYALDGFGIYSQYENGKELFTKDLDACHGTTTPVMWEGKETNMYHYVVTRDYPYTVSCFRGTLIDSTTNSKTRRELNMPPIGR